MASRKTNKNFLAFNIIEIIKKEVKDKIQNAVGYTINAQSCSILISLSPCTYKCIIHLSRIPIGHQELISNHNPRRKWIYKLPYIAPTASYSFTKKKKMLLTQTHITIKTKILNEMRQAFKPRINCSQAKNEHQNTFYISKDKIFKTLSILLCGYIKFIPLNKPQVNHQGILMHNMQIQQTS